MRQLFIAIFALCALTAFSQAKKPSMMVFPSDTWYTENGFTKTFNVNGEEKTVPDYERAFIECSDLNMIISTINDLMGQRGFPLKDLQATVKGIAQRSAEDAASASKETGAGIAVSERDMILNRAKADIVLEAYWKVTRMGPTRRITFNLRALDSYTNFQVARTGGDTDPVAGATVQSMVSTAMQGGIDEFCDGLMAHFTDMGEKGRQVRLNIKIWEDSPWDLEYDVNGDELSFVIEEWVGANTVNGVFNLTDQTETMMEFQDVRIPLYRENGAALDTRYWAQGLRKHLKSLGIESKMLMRGLGEANIIIGGK